MTYLVTSDNFAYPRGTELTAEQLAGTSVEALIKGGHITPSGDQPVEPPADGEGA